jgi:hypothetical protein
MTNPMKWLGIVVVSSVLLSGCTLKAFESADIMNTEPEPTVSPSPEPVVTVTTTPTEKPVKVTPSPTPGTTSVESLEVELGNMQLEDENFE